MLHRCINHVEKVVRLLGRWKRALGNMQQTRFGYGAKPLQQYSSYTFASNILCPGCKLKGCFTLKMFWKHAKAVVVTSLSQSWLVPSRTHLRASGEWESIPMDNLSTPEKQAVHLPQRLQTTTDGEDTKGSPWLRETSHAHGSQT